MFAVFLALFAPDTQAAEIEVALAVPIGVFVDGVPMQGDEGSGLGVARDLAPGRHVLETRNMMGKTTAYKELDLAADDRVRFEYRQKELWHIGTYKIAGAPPSTTVVQTTTTTVPASGMGVTVSDGVDTVTVGVGVGAYGGGMVVTDGQNTVSMNAGISVTETTTTTTTTVVSSGGSGVAVAAPAPAASSAMDERAFGTFLRQLDNASFSDEKLALIETTAANNWMSCDQLARILDTLDHGSDKVKAVGIVRNSIVDPQNAFVLNDKFSFSSDAQKAQAYFR